MTNISRSSSPVSGDSAYTSAREVQVPSEYDTAPETQSPRAGHPLENMSPPPRPDQSTTTGSTTNPQSTTLRHRDFSSRPLPTRVLQTGSRSSSSDSRASINNLVNLPVGVPDEEGLSQLGDDERGDEPGSSDNASGRSSPVDHTALPAADLLLTQLRPQRMIGPLGGPGTGRSRADSPPQPASKAGSTSAASGASRAGSVAGSQKIGKTAALDETGSVAPVENPVTPEQLEATVNEIQQAVDDVAAGIVDEVARDADAAEVAGSSATSSSSEAPAPGTRNDASRPSSPLQRSASPGPTHAETIQMHRNVNDISYLKNALPEDLRGGVRHMLLPLREQFPSRGAFETFVNDQSTVLEECGIRGKRDLINLMRTVNRSDNLMRVAQGTVGGLHFNGPGLAFSYGPLSTEMTVGTAVDTNVLQGAASGFLAGASDAIATPAKEATFKDAYYKRPAADHLPEFLRNFNPPSLGESINETNKAWVGGFAAGYVVRGSVMAAVTYTKGAEAAAAIETAMAPVTNIASGVTATFIGHSLDEQLGRTGLPYFLARDNLGECVRAAQQSNLAYAGKAVVGAGTHVVNAVTKFPEGLKRAVTDPALIASTASLTGVLTVPGTVAGVTANAISDPNTAHVASSLVHYPALLTAWAGWGTSFAAAAHVHAERTARNRPGDEEQGSELTAQPATSGRTSGN
ncbi:hypothetical protein [Paraburkholderia megapolitana]|uniref:hypothetical protein n=1 Tax=Paraburkholderia megapolitana TaxID=420953 RepID=UPI0038B8F9E4